MDQIVQTIQHGDFINLVLHISLNGYFCVLILITIIFCRNLKISRIIHRLSLTVSIIFSWFVLIFFFFKVEKKNLGLMNIQMQEYVLIEDILYCMMSIEGTYIKKRPDILDKNKYNYCIEPYLEAPTCGN